MFEIAKNKYKKFSKSNPNWKEILFQKAEENDVSTNSAIANDFDDIISDLCDSIRTSECTLEDAISLFDPDVQSSVQVQILSRLRPFFAFAAIRKFESNSKAQIENLIETIWQQRIIRRNPNFDINAERDFNLEINNSDLNEFSLSLNAIVDHCISRLLNYDGMLHTLKVNTQISDDLCAYIARKIDKDYEELQRNYLIKRLMVLSRG